MNDQGPSARPRRTIVTILAVGWTVAIIVLGILWAIGVL
jgi:hypothetical protein